MRHEADFERWLADWIETGPNEAPDRTVERAIVYAGTHRQRRLTRSAVWRGVMDRMHLTPVTAPSARNGWLLAAVVVAAVVLIAVAVVGSGTLRFGGADEPLPAVGGSVTPAPATPAPSPVAVTERGSCTVANSGNAATVLGIDHQWGVEFGCLVSASDPRVTGASKVTIAGDVRADQSGDIWGTDVITNKDGTWDGHWWGTIDKGYGTHRIEDLYTGTGAYAGLVYRTHVTSEDAGMNTTGTGIIRPVGTTLTGTEACTVTDGGQPGVNAGDIGAIRGVVFTCTDTMPDPRVSGTATITASKDQRADGTGEIWGDYVLRNVNGSWVGRWSGTAETTTEHLYGILTGTGAYSGLEYWFHGEGIGSPDDTMTGTIVPVS